MLTDFCTASNAVKTCVFSGLSLRKIKLVMKAKKLMATPGEGRQELYPGAKLYVSPDWIADVRGENEETETFSEAFRLFIRYRTDRRHRAGVL